MLPDPPSRALAGDERTFWVRNINRPLFNSFNLASQEVLMHVSLHLDEKLLGCGITKINI